MFSLSPKQAELFVGSRYEETLRIVDVCMRIYVIDREKKSARLEISQLAEDAPLLLPLLAYLDGA